MAFFRINACSTFELYAKLWDKLMLTKYMIILLMLILKGQYQLVCEELRKNY